ncbi:penicillin-binding transpeptidase domain-containing protein [Raineyella fluvialis]|uniref:penicillin-binding transpeptidase domain-containing protein n=1 Tax=Raineyella fluvialis TaxID=2662261 RepID=UPI00188E44B1|nr:penicillin-binding transpeptidase domain-containing protein [Raineyella fluvialis]
MSRTSRRMVPAALTLILLTGTAGCGALTQWGLPTEVTALEHGLESGNLAGLRTSNGTDPGADLNALTSGMDGVRPQVTPGRISVNGQKATVPLTYDWAFPAGTWHYDATATYSRTGGKWALDWAPTTVHPSLSATTRLVHRRTQATRGQILGHGGVPIVKERDTFTLGLDKSTIPADKVDDSARRIATALGIDQQRYLDRVHGAGAIAFVDALTIRADRAQVSPDFIATPGARIQKGVRQLAPTATFAQGVLGSVGTADANQAKASGGTILEGDPIGVGGLQQRYDAQLRGKPGDRVIIAPRDTPAGQSADPPAIFNATPTAGAALETTLDESTQTKAEQALSGVHGSAALVAVDTTSGALLAAATSPDDAANPTATFGRFAPGSTFKVVTSLALLRSGLTPDSALDCPPNVTVDGRTFTNYSEFPSRGLGRTTLRMAVSNSCNTAMIGQRDRITPQQLTDAAASLGLGKDHDAGFPAFYGSVPPPANPVGGAEALIGQGLVEASPMALAGVAASVAGGHTVVPYLLEAHRPTADAAPLTAQEATALQTIMQSVVTDGTASALRGTLTGAKTGTAEYGTDNPPKTHAWMIGYRDGVAVAAYVGDGTSGAASAGPLLKAFLGS